MAMRYLTSVIVGLAAAVVASAIWVLAVFILPVFMPFLISRFSGSVGSGGGAASVGSGSILAVSHVGFLVGFVWNLRRASKLRAQSSQGGTGLN
jgi:hypothetical protein